MPEWLENHDYKPPLNTLDCPWQTGVGTDLDFFGWHQANPVQGERFNAVMQGVASEWKTPMDLYPVQERLIDGFEGGVLVVDVGGGLGHDLQRIIDRDPVPAAQYILQDFAEIVAAAPVKEPITTMAHDFFTDQPVQGQYKDIQNCGELMLTRC